MTAEAASALKLVAMFLTTLAVFPIWFVGVSAYGGNCASHILDPVRSASKNECLFASNSLSARSIGYQQAEESYQVTFEELSETESLINQAVPKCLMVNYQMTQANKAFYKLEILVSSRNTEICKDLR